jgi:hypothetical protein
LLFNIPLKYAIRKIQEKQGGTEIKWNTSAAGYVDEVNVLGG